MRLSRPAVAGALVILVAVLAASCGSMASPQGWASPIVDGSTTYLFQKKDKLSAIEFGADGHPSTRWTFPNKDRQNQKDLKVEAVYTTPILDGDRLYLGTYGAEVYAIATKDGELLWRDTDVTGSIVGGPVLAGDLLVFGTTEGRLYGINRSDGRSAPGWPAGGLKLGDGIWAPPAVSGGIAYVATMRGEVHAIKLADRSEAWPKPFKISGAIASLQLLDETHLFVPGLNHKVFIVDTTTGEAAMPAFQASDWVWSTAAFRNNIAYFGDFSGHVYALDITTGQAKWTYSGKNAVKAAPALLDDVLVVADRLPEVHFLDANTGAPLNSVPLVAAGTVRANPIPDSGTALVLTTAGKLFRADPKTRSANPVALTGGAQ